MGKIIKKRVEYGGSSNSAENIKYDDTKNVKEAINEVDSLLGNTDISAIGDGTVTGGLDALNSNLSKFPNYTNILHTFSFNTAWTATEDCVLVGYVQAMNLNSVILYINEDTSFTVINNNFTSWVGASFYLPVKKGTTLRFYTESTDNTRLQIKAYTLI